MRYNPNIKPRLWNIHPAEMAYSAAGMGLPMPAALWWMPENGGDKIYDYSGQNNHGTFVNSPVWVPQGIDFEAGSTQRIDIDSPFGLPDGTADFSFIAGIKIESLTDIRSLLGGSDYDPLWHIGTNGKLDFYEGTESTDPVPVGVKTQVAAVRSGTGANELAYYIDGINAGLANCSVSLKLNTATSIASGNGNDSYKVFDGIIYYFYIFSVALTPTQVATLSADPYGLLRPIPWWEWVYVSAAGDLSINVHDCADPTEALA